MSVLNVADIIKEINEINDRNKQIIDELPASIVTACPSGVMWMDDADRTRFHELKMKLQELESNEPQLAKERIMERITKRRKHEN